MLAVPRVVTAALCVIQIVRTEKFGYSEKVYRFADEIPYAEFSLYQKANNPEGKRTMIWPFMKESRKCLEKPLPEYADLDSNIRGSGWFVLWIDPVSDVISFGSRSTDNQLSVHIDAPWIGTGMCNRIAKQFNSSISHLKSWLADSRNSRVHHLGYGNIVKSGYHDIVRNSKMIMAGGIDYSHSENIADCYESVRSVLIVK